MVLVLTLAMVFPISQYLGNRKYSMDLAWLRGLRYRCHVCFPFLGWGICWKHGDDVGKGAGEREEGSLDG